MRIRIFLRRTGNARPYDLAITLLTIDLDGLVGELGGAFAAGGVDVGSHLVSGDVHHTKTLQDLFGAGASLTVNQMSF